MNASLNILCNKKLDLKISLCLIKYDALCKNSSKTSVVPDIIYYNNNSYDLKADLKCPSQTGSELCVVDSKVGQAAF